MMLSSAAYREMTHMLSTAARRLCNGRILMTHEGGYSEMYAPYCGLAVLEELSGIKTDIADPWEPLMAAWGGNELQPHQAAVIDAAAALVTRLPAAR